MSRFIDEYAELHLGTNDLRRALEYWLNSRVMGDHIRVLDVKLNPKSSTPACISIKCIEPPKVVSKPTEVKA